MARAITPEQAIAAIGGRETVHVFIGNGSLHVGADWDVGDAFALIREPHARCYLAAHPLKHNLAVEVPNKSVRYLDVTEEEIEKQL